MKMQLDILRVHMAVDMASKTATYSAEVSMGGSPVQIPVTADLFTLLLESIEEPQEQEPYTPQEGSPFTQNERGEMVYAPQEPEPVLPVAPNLDNAPRTVPMDSAGNPIVDQAGPTASEIADLADGELPSL